MLSEIFHRGPITCGVACPEDFTWDYRGGIYRDHSGDTELDHGGCCKGLGVVHGLYGTVRGRGGEAERRVIMHGHSGLRTMGFQGHRYRGCGTWGEQGAIELRGISGGTEAGPG